MAEQESGSNVVSLRPQDNPSPYSLQSNYDIFVAGMCHFGDRSESRRALEPKFEVSREFDKDAVIHIHH